MALFDFSKWAELRDDFAIAAMAEIMRADPELPKDLVASNAYETADAMMYARTRGMNEREQGYRQRSLNEKGYWHDPSDAPAPLTNPRVGRVEDFGIKKPNVPNPYYLTPRG